MLAGLALVAYVVRALAWPLTAGRDLDEYLYAYVQLFDRDVLLPWSMLFRTPITPLFAGLSLDVFDGRLAEPLMALLYAGSIVCWAGGARYFGPWVAIAVAASLLLYQGYALMYHELSSEPVFAAAFAVWALLVVRATFAPSVSTLRARRPGCRRSRARPPGQRGAARLRPRPAPRRRLAGARASSARVRFALAAVLPLLPGRSTTASASTRGGSRVAATRSSPSTARSSPTTSSRRRTASNRAGSPRRCSSISSPASRTARTASRSTSCSETAASASTRTCTCSPIRSSAGTTDYRVLREAGVEGVRAHPGTYARGVGADDMGRAREGAVPSRLASSDDDGADATRRRRPSSSAGSVAGSERGRADPGRAGRVDLATGQSIRQVWTSPTDWHFEFATPATRPRFERIQREVDELFAALPDRHGNARLALRYNQLSRWFPRPWMWILLGLDRRSRGGGREGGRPSLRSRSRLSPSCR